MLNILDKLEQLFGKEQTLEDKAGAFSVVINNAKKADQLLAYAKNQGLSIPNIGIFNPHKITLGASSLSFLFDGEKDVNIIDTAFENVVRDLVPRYVVDNTYGDDFFEVRELIRIAGQQKKALRKKLSKKLITSLKGKTYLELLAIEKEYNDGIGSFVNLLSENTCPCRRVVNNPVQAVAAHYVIVDGVVVPKKPNDTVVVEVEL